MSPSSGGKRSSESFRERAARPTVCPIGGIRLIRGSSPVVPGFLIRVSERDIGIQDEFENQPLAPLVR